MTYHSDGVNWIDNCEEENVVRLVIVFSETLIDTYYSSERTAGFIESSLFQARPIESRLSVIRPR